MGFVNNNNNLPSKPIRKSKLGAKSRMKGKPGNKAVGGGTDSSQCSIRRYFCPEERGISLGSSNTQGSKSTKKFDLSLQNYPFVKTDFEKANKDSETL